MKLYEIDGTLERLLPYDGERFVDPETGEILTMDAVEDLEMDREKKIDGCCAHYKNLKSDYEQLKETIDRLVAKQKSIKRSMDWMKQYLDMSLKGEKFKNAYHSVYYKKSTSVEVDESKLISMDDVYKKVVTTADKTAIKKALDEGVEIDGCNLVTKSSIVIGGC